MPTKPKTNPKSKWWQVLLQLGPSILGEMVIAAGRSADNGVKRQSVIDIALATAGRVLGVVGAQTNSGLATQIGALVDTYHAVLKPILPKPGHPLVVPGPPGAP